MNLAKVIQQAVIIAETLETIDNRCMAADGPVTPTLSEAEPDELRNIYVAADTIRKQVAAKRKGGRS